MSRRDDGKAAILLALMCLAAGHASAEDPKAAARAVVQAGRAAASAIARDSGSTAHVPGYAGTNLPERGMSAGDLETAANRVLADPADPGGRAGRAVIEAAAARRAAEVEAGDPVVRRGDGIEGDAHSPRWKADGLASGSATGCGAGVEDAGAGGRCGSVSWCVGADCETAESQANTGFVESAARTRYLGRRCAKRVLGEAAGASRSRRWSASTSRRWTSPSSPRTCWTGRASRPSTSRKRTRPAR